MVPSNQPGVLESQATSRHAALGLTDRDVVEMYAKMRLGRLLDERMWILKRQGKIPFHVSCQGQEAAQVGVAYALRPGVDFAFPYYRDTGVVLVLGMTAREVMLHAFVKAEDPNSGGRQMPGHWSSPRLRIVSGSSPVATQIPQAVGAALAAKIKGEESIVMVSFGDGVASKGDFHEGLNFAGVHKAPVIFLCENNGYAISVPLSKQMAVTKVAERAAGYGFPGVTVDGMDVLAVYEAAKAAADRARRGEGPTLLEAMVYRFLPHTSDDNDTRYRSPEEVAAWKERDPIRTFRRYLIDSGATDEDELRRLETEIGALVDDATAYAESAPYPAPETALRYVYHEPDADPAPSWDR